MVRGKPMSTRTAATDTSTRLHTLCC